jgi:hypothetical protein
MISRLFPKREKLGDQCGGVRVREIVGGILLAILVVKELLDLAATIDYVEQKWPRLVKWAERKWWQHVLMLVLTIMYAGILYEDWEGPKVNIVSFPNSDPGAKDAQIRQLRTDIEYLKTQSASQQAMLNQRSSSPAVIANRKIIWRTIWQGTQNYQGYVATNFLLFPDHTVDAPVRITITFTDLMVRPPTVTLIGPVPKQLGPSTIDGNKATFTIIQPSITQNVEIMLAVFAAKQVDIADITCSTCP